MSRHYVTSRTGQKFVYGFDNPLQQYFLDRIKSAEEITAEQKKLNALLQDANNRGELVDYREVTEIVDIIGPLSGVYGSHSKLMEEMVKYRIWNLIPESRKEAIVFDLPF